MKRNRILFIAFLICLLIAPVIAVDYTFWNTHRLEYTGPPYVVSGAPPNGIQHLYTDSPNIVLENQSAFCTSKGTYCTGTWPFALASMQIGSASPTGNQSMYDWAQPGMNQNLDAMAIYPVLHYMKGIDGTAINHYDNWGDGSAMQGFIGTGNGNLPYGPLYIYHSTTSPPSETAGVNFTGSPVYGFLPLQVQFTDTSNQTNIIRTWNFGDGQISNGTSASIVHTYSQAGVYTVMLDGKSALYGWNNKTRSNYITATNPSGVVFNVDIKDSISGALIQDSAVGIRNTTSGVWRNGTAPTGLIYYDTTDPGYLYPLSVNQSVTIAGSKTGYQSASLTFSIPYDNYRAFLYLVPSSVVNATGTGTVVATVVRNKDGLPLSGTSVTLSTGQMGVTNSAGAVTLRNVTAGTPTATAINSGYQTTSSTFTLSAGETKMVVIQMVLDGESPVTTYGSPTPTRTPGPGDPGYAGVNTSSGALNERGSTGLMEMMGQLIELWPLVLIILFMKFMKDAFS